ncbi:hypothetical protein LHU53_16005 [Rhodoferax sp. U2-2l]|uniref:tetratricopeptide repeat protein n=1 Tax=Rhodoferax sp. U2-2l TaxID=2884000 RepID=UPI001D09EFF9|nr:hypothetical protein [Rhodoferax sp. U2-2l]MCB8748405.1 hypothetical protein [Rhodoferax sp. U2-2l]
MKLFSTFVLAAACVLPFSSHAAPLDDAIADLQRDWEVIRYQTPESARLKRFEALSAKAHSVSQTFAGRSEPLVWEGIIVSSLANEKGGLGALSLAKQAKVMYEQAIALRGDALDGSAYGSLAVLYYKVPGWPLGFGDKARAEELLKKALSLNPTGIDPNYFYADYLVEVGRGAEATPYLERALAAPPRPGREVADTGRREEVRQLLAKVKAL